MEVKTLSREKKIYAAYGSNMNLQQMAFRCPDAVVIGNAELPGYELLFRGFDGGSVATVEPKVGSSVPVVLWEITPVDEEALDHYEGWPDVYRKETVVVKYDGEPAEVMFYVMNGNRSLGAPSEYYFNTILEGYTSAGFDIETLVQAVSSAK